MAYLAHDNTPTSSPPAVAHSTRSGGFLETVSSFLHPVRRGATSTASTTADRNGAGAIGGHGGGGGVVRASTLPSPQPIPRVKLSGAPEDPSLLSTRLEDADLFRFAVDYEEVTAILTAPSHDHAQKPDTNSPSAAGAGRTPEAGILSPSTLYFTRIGADVDGGITLESSPVPDCPVHLMRATAIMPCSPAEFLQYMDNRVRPLWDTYTEKAYLVRELASPALVEAQLARASAQPRTGSLQVEPAAPVVDDDTTAASAAAAKASLASQGNLPFAYLPGQQRVALHYLAVRSPVPFVQNRDFELVVNEEVRPDGTAYMKAFSAPFGYCVPVDVDQNRYVRAVCMSGVVARPLAALSANDPLRHIPRALRHLHDSSGLTEFMNDGTGGSGSRSGVRDATKSSSVSSASTARGGPISSTPGLKSSSPAAPHEFCIVSYYGLVHPMGMIPPVVANMVISAQLSTLRNLQKYIIDHPLSSLLPADVQAQRRTPQRTSPSKTDASGEAQRGRSSGAATKKSLTWRERLLSKL